MLSIIGAQTNDDLFQDIPEAHRLRKDLNLPKALDEISLTSELRSIASGNRNADENICFLGAGIYDHFIPAIVDSLASRGEFATSYTPYQPEMSQGMLQAIYEYQSLICSLTGMELSNASMYDGATALAEAALMAIESSGRKKALVSHAVNPHYRRVLQTYLRTAGYDMEEFASENGASPASSLALQLDDKTACVIIQHPNFFGCLEDLAALTTAAHNAGAMMIVSADPISLGLLKPPGEYGVDVVTGEGQGLGCPMGFGGPLLGFFACRMERQRQFPGRIVGATTDQDGRKGFTMTLRTREQDIRREKATSNICTNEALMALYATVYLCAMGKHGLSQAANLCLQKAHYAAKKLAMIDGVSLIYTAPFFKEFAIRLPSVCSPQVLNLRLLDKKIIGGYDLGISYPELNGCMLLCVTENRTREDIDRLAGEIECIVKEGC
jgi:glycine dehydrogenase subunit 1